MVMDELAAIGSVEKEKIKGQIFEFRGIRVMLDCDIAGYFGVETGALNRSMKRNIKRFPDTFCFQLSDEELSLCQSGIAMQTVGVKGGRTSNPYVYSEQGVAMLTSTLHTDRAIEASIMIIEAFVEMSHFLRQNEHLIPTNEILLLSARQDKLQDEVIEIKKNMITRADLTDMIELFETGISNKEVLILNGEPFKADLAYQRIYSQAKSSIIVIDDYIGIKTLQHLSHSVETVKLTIISDNKGCNPLRLSEYTDYLLEYPGREIRFIRSDNKMHDRYIILDHDTENVRVFHCGASSKDAGRRITTITEIREVDIYKDMISDLLAAKQLQLR